MADFNPLDSKNYFVGSDWIKEKYVRQLTSQEKEFLSEALPEKRMLLKRSLLELAVGAIVGTESGRVAFIYSSRKMFDQKIESYQEERTKVLKLYQGLSLEAFMEAEKVYLRAGNLDDVESFLTKGN